jgi:hypothetical protein
VFVPISGQGVFCLATSEQGQRSLRALMPEDRVEGLGSKRYQNNRLVAQIVENAVYNLLGTLRAL